jgi:hypothetical protein
MLIFTGIATGVASIVLAGTVFGLFSPKPISLYDIVKGSDEVESFLEKYPTANVTTPFYDCLEICPPRTDAALKFTYLHSDTKQWAQLVVTQLIADPDSPPAFRLICLIGDTPDSTSSINGTRIENISDFLENRCPT